MKKAQRLRLLGALVAPTLAFTAALPSHVDASPGGVPGATAVFSARYVGAAVEVDPAFGEAAGILLCNSTLNIGATVGGACFDLHQYAGLDEVTQVFPDFPSDTPTTTLFQGYDVDGDNCVACIPGGSDPAWESDGSGIIGVRIPATTQPLQVFVRTASLHDDGQLRHSISGTLVVSVVDNTHLAQVCPGHIGLPPGCGQPFTGNQCTPDNPGPPVCLPLPYPYPGIHQP